MKKITLVLALALGLMGCNEMKGTLTATESLRLQDKDGKAVTVNTGTYNAELSAKDENTVKVKLEGAGSNGKDLKFNFTLPSNTMNSGHFDIPAAQTGQAYGVRGDHNLTTTQSEVRSTYESCQYDTWEQYCWSDKDGHVTCQSQRVTRFGQRYVEYRDVTENETLALDLVNSNNGSAAHFDGSRSDYYRDYIHQDYCH